MCKSTTKTHNSVTFKAIFSKWLPAQSSTLKATTSTNFGLQPSFIYHVKQQTLMFPNVYTSKTPKMEVKTGFVGEGHIL